MCKLIKSHLHEVSAYTAALIALYIGFDFASRNHAEPLGAAGATIIVFGVLLASSRKFERMQAKVINFINSRREPERETVKLILADSCGSTSKEEVDQLLDGIIQDLVKQSTALIDQRRKLFKIHEVVLVCLGTLVNGFAPFIMQLAK